MHRITPMDIFNKDFRTVMRGYERKEVDRFLDIVLQSYEDVLHENEHLKEQVRKLKREGQRYGTNRYRTVSESDEVLQEILTRIKRLEKMNFG